MILLFIIIKEKFKKKKKRKEIFSTKSNQFIWEDNQCIKNRRAQEQLIETDVDYSEKEEDISEEQLMQLLRSSLMEEMELADTGLLDTEVLVSEDTSTDLINSRPDINKKTVDCNLRSYSKGEILNGQYRVERVLGKGGMGRVYLCTNIKLGNLWAIKHIFNKGGNKRALIAEEEILKKLNSIYLPKIVDVFCDETGTYIVENYIEGISLDKKIEMEGIFDEKIVVEWGKQLAEALDYLHNMRPHPIIYRDMKPSNVIITRDNKAILIDFGISKEYNPYKIVDSVIAATVKYAAPEQVAGITDQRSDIYSLGVMLYQLLTGKFPTEGALLRDINPHVSEEIEEIVLRCINHEPSRRYQRAIDLKEDLEGIHELKLQNAKKMQKMWILGIGSILLGMVGIAMLIIGYINIVSI